MWNIVKWVIMSRIGKKPIEVPNGVKVDINDNLITVTGALGVSSISLLEGASGVKLNYLNNVINVEPKSEEKQDIAYQGLFRSLIYNMVTGVSKGFEKNLEIVGVGYRATQQGPDIQFQLGFSHQIIFKAPKDIKLEVIDPTKIKVSGIDKQVVGQVAANIRELRSPEPYKGKGIRYKDEVVRKKAGKTGKK